MFYHGCNSNYKFYFSLHCCRRRGFSFYWKLLGFFVAIRFKMTLIVSFSCKTQSHVSMVGFQAKERVFRLQVLQISAGTSKESVTLNDFSRKNEFLLILLDFLGKQGLKRLDLKFYPVKPSTSSSSYLLPSRLMQNSCNLLCLITVLLALRIWVKSFGSMQASELLLLRPLLLFLPFLLSSAILRCLLKKGLGARLLKNWRSSMALGIRSGTTGVLAIVLVRHLLLMCEMGLFWWKWRSVCLKISSRSSCPLTFNDSVSGTCIAFQTAIMISIITNHQTQHYTLLGDGQALTVFYRIYEAGPVSLI